MAFRFSLQKIVDLKGNQKTQAEWMLSEAIGKLRKEQSTLSELMEERLSHQKRLNEAIGSPTPIAEVQRMQQYAEHLERLIEGKHADVRAAQTQVDGKQQALLERTMDEKVWQKSREKAYRHYQSLVNKKEQETLDEMASVRLGTQPS